ncbi:mas-related G-protein coupled receptor MRG-like [Equus caballus]|uniref:mas-related G-protein coupled receptor MRG-like n=1 Tax=Equus caballus TaxID=9796 RepID=UPI00015614CB
MSGPCTSTYDFKPNGTFSGDPEKTQASKILSPLAVFVSLWGLAGNGLVLGPLVFSVKWDHFTVFIFHLSLADFIYLSCQTVVLVKIMLDAFHNIWFDAWPLEVFTYASYTVGLCLLAAISMGRCLAVLFPIWYRFHLPKHTSTILCILIWVSSIALNVVRFLSCCHSHPFLPCNVCLEIFAVFVCALPSAIIMCILTTLFRIKYSSRLRPPVKLYVVLLLSVLFLPCSCAVVIQVHTDPYSNAPYLFWLWILLSCVNSSANPFIYYFVGRFGKQRRQEHLREIFQRTLGEEADPRGDTSSGEVSSSI